MNHKLTALLSIVFVALFMLACSLSNIAAEVESGAGDLVAFKRLQLPPNSPDLAKYENFERAAHAFRVGVDNASTDAQKVALVPALAELAKAFRNEFLPELQGSKSGLLVAFTIDSALRRLSSKFTAIARKLPPEQVDAAVQSDVSTAAPDLRASLGELEAYLQTAPVKKP